MKKQENKAVKAMPATQVAPRVPKVPTDPAERREYDAKRRGSSDKAKLERGERRVTTWLPKEAVDALDRITGSSAERGAVQAALVAALLAYAPPIKGARKSART